QRDRGRLDIDAPAGSQERGTSQIQVAGIAEGRSQTLVEAALGGSHPLPIDPELELVTQRDVVKLGLDIDLTGHRVAELLQIGFHAAQGGRTVGDLDEARGAVDGQRWSALGCEELFDLV